MSLRGSELRAALADLRGVVRENVSLKPASHIRIGGPAAFFVEPFTEEDAAKVVRVAVELDLPLFVLGGGSNLVVADEGVQGIVMSLARLDRMMRDGTRLTAGAGVTLPSLISNTKRVGLAGLELLIGIPAQLGGAVAMNAGTRDTQTFDHLISVTVIEADGKIRVLDRDSCSPSYRNGGMAGRVVVQACFDLDEDDSDAIHERLEASLRRRNATQPVTQKSVGCVFTNPDGDSAGRLIEAAGCKLRRRGGVSVSAKHANYFVNDGDGTCADFLELLEEVRQRVEEFASLSLVPEVKIWGI